MKQAKPPKALLIKHNAYCAGDSAYASMKRLKASLWREEKKIPIGLNPRTKSPLGNFIESEFAIKAKPNFLTDAIKEVVLKKVIENSAESQNHALIEEERLWENMLSSQPLCFNLFGELSIPSNKEMATSYFQVLFPEFKIKEVLKVDFEFSPGRGSLHCDRSAFDVFVEYRNLNEELGFLGIEVKFVESLKTKRNDSLKSYQKHKECYLDIARKNPQVFSEGFLESFGTEMPKVELFQILRDHLLTFTMLSMPNENGVKKYAQGYFVFLYPKGNKNCEKAVTDYKLKLTSPEEHASHFLPRYLDDFIIRLTHLHNSGWTRELKSRYIDDPLF